MGHVRATKIGATFPRVNETPSSLCDGFFRIFGGDRLIRAAVSVQKAYIKSQAHEGWRLIHDHYDDGAFSGASLDRPALQKMLAEIQARKIDIVVVYKVDRLTRSLTSPS